jgi:hypothetical protein
MTRRQIFNITARHDVSISDVIASHCDVIISADVIALSAECSAVSQAAGCLDNERHEVDSAHDTDSNNHVHENWID